MLESLVSLQYLLRIDVARKEEPILAGDFCSAEEYTVRKSGSGYDRFSVDTHIVE